MDDEEIDEIEVVSQQPDYLVTLSPRSLENYAQAARHIQLWFSIFHPRFDTTDRSILYRAIYDAGSGPEKICAKVLQQWYRVYVGGYQGRRASRRSSVVQSSRLFGKLPLHKIKRLSQTEKKGSETAIPTMLDVVKEAVSHVIHEWKAAEEGEFIAIRDSLLDKDEEDMVKEIRELTSLRLRLESSDSSNNLMRPGDTLLHFLVQALPQLPSSVLHEFYREGLQIHEKGANDRSLLHAAAHGKNLQTVQVLIDEGIDVSATDSYGCCALHDAAKVGALDVVEYLIETTRLNVNVANNNGRTPLHYAAEYNQLEIAEYLIQHAANLNAINGNMRTPLHMAATRGHMDMISLLLQYGAEIRQNVTGDTIFHDVAKNNHVEVMEMFTKQSGYARYAVAKNNQDRTPLHIAAANSAVEVYILLNANPWDGKHAGLTKDVFGYYPLNLLIESEAIPLEQGLCMNKFIPCNSRSDPHPIWHGDLFYSILRDSPDYAWAFLDAYKVAVSWSCGRTEWSFPKLGDMYGQPNAVEKSALGILIEEYNRGDRDKREQCIKCLSHIVLTRILHLKWKSFGRTMYFVELFGSIFLLFTTTVCVSLSNVQVEFTQTRFSLLVFLWTIIFIVTTGAIYASFNFGMIKRKIQNSHILNPHRTVKEGSIQSRGLLQWLIPDKLMRRGSSMAYKFVRSNSTLRQITPRGLPGTMKLAQDKQRIVLKDKVIAGLIASILLILGFFGGLIASSITFESLGESTANAADLFFRVNIIIRCFVAVLFICVEALEFHGNPRRYLRTTWSVIKVAVLVCIVVIETPLHLNLMTVPGMSVSDAQSIMYSVTCLLLWINFLQVLRVNGSTGPMITMVLNMIPDVSNFLMMYTVFQMGLTCAYFALLKGQKGFTTFSEAFIRTYLVLFGQLDVDTVLTQDYPRQFFISSCIMLHYLVVAIVLLNALIATLTMTAETVLERVKEQVAFNHAESILRAEITLPVWLRAKLRTQAKAKKTKSKTATAFSKTIYIKDDENKLEDTMDETIKNMERTLQKCVDDVHELTVQVQDMQRRMEERLIEETNKTQAVLDTIVLLLSTTHESRSHHRGALAPNPNFQAHN